jgi:putative membrane protein
MMHSNFNGSWFCGPGGFFFGVPFGGIIHVILWGFLLYFLYRIARTLLSSHPINKDHNSSISSSLIILEERYASGEIDQEEFLRKKKDLGS